MPDVRGTGSSTTSTGNKACSEGEWSSSHSTAGMTNGGGNMASGIESVTGGNQKETLLIPHDHNFNSKRFLKNN